jgi:hypothetical protein
MRLRIVDHPCDAPVAQLDRASVFGTEGWGFESLRVYWTYRHHVAGRRKGLQRLHLLFRTTVSILLASAHCGTLLRRILRRFVEVLLGHLPVVGFGHGLRMAQPSRRDIGRVGLDEFRGATGPHIHERLLPHRHPRSPGDPSQLGPEVRVAVTVACDDVLRTFGRLIEYRFELNSNFGEERDRAETLAGRLPRFHVWDGHSLLVPENVAPAQGQHFGRAP